MPESTRNASGPVYEFNVGGECFYFSKETLELCHNKGSIPEQIMHGAHVKKTPFLDVDPSLFRKFCAPYIRHELFPVIGDFSSVTEQKHLVAAAKYMGLANLGNYIEHEMTNRSYFVKIKLFLKSQSLQVTRSILVQSTDTVATLRQAVVDLIATSREPELRELPVGKQFMFEGFVLAEDKTMEYYGIGPSSELEL